MGYSPYIRMYTHRDQTHTFLCLLHWQAHSYFCTTWESPADTMVFRKVLPWGRKTITSCWWAWCSQLCPSLGIALSPAPLSDPPTIGTCLPRGWPIANNQLMWGYILTPFLHGKQFWKAILLKTQLSWSEWGKLSVSWSSQLQLQAKWKNKAFRYFLWWSKQEAKTRESTNSLLPMEGHTKWGSAGSILMWASAHSLKEPWANGSSSFMTSGVKEEEA